MFLKIISMISFLLVLAGCASREASTPTQVTSPVKSPSSAFVDTKPNWEKEWANLVHSAKKEGKVVVINTAS